MFRPLALTLLSASIISAQRNMGELHLRVNDAAGAPIETNGTLDCRSAQYHQTFRTTADGTANLKPLPYCVYKLQLARTGFATLTQTIDVHTELPVARTFTL